MPMFLRMGVLQREETGAQKRFCYTPRACLTKNCMNPTHLVELTHKGHKRLHNAIETSAPFILRKPSAAPALA